jgi:hypothetical protein
MARVGGSSGGTPGTVGCVVTSIDEAEYTP